MKISWFANQDHTFYDCVHLWEFQLILITTENLYLISAMKGLPDPVWRTLLQVTVCYLPTVILKVVFSTILTTELTSLKQSFVEELITIRVDWLDYHFKIRNRIAFTLTPFIKANYVCRLDFNIYIKSYDGVLTAFHFFNLNISVLS